MEATVDRKSFVTARGVIQFIEKRLEELNRSGGGIRSNTDAFKHIKASYDAAVGRA